MKVLIVGGTGLISRQIVNLLAKTGHAVTIVNRGSTGHSVPRQVEHLKQNRYDRERFDSLFRKRTFDAVVDVVCFGAADADQTIRVFGESGAHIVIVSSVAAYRRPYRSIPVEENDIELWIDPDYQYAYEKAQMERYLFGEIERGLPITIVRPSLTFGPGARNVGVLRQNVGILHRIVNGRPLIMFGDGTVPWSFSFSRDVARAIIGLIGNEAAKGAHFHIASEEITDWSGLYQAFGQIAGAAPQIKRVPTNWLNQVDPARFGHIYYEKCYPGVFSIKKLRSVLPGFHFETSLLDGLQQVARSWEQDRLAPDPTLDRLEDQLVAAADGGMNTFKRVATG